MLRAAIILLLLAACAEVRPYRLSNPPDANGLLVTQTVRRVFAETKMPGTPQVSKLSAAHPVSPGDWRVCMRSSDAAHRLRYALYFTGYTFVRAQTAVLVDRCDDEAYLPFVADVATGRPLTGQPIPLDRHATSARGVADSAMR